MKQAHSVVEVAKLLGLTPAATRELVKTLFGGPRDVLSFQDLVLLRTAHGLSSRKVPRARITEARTFFARIAADERMSAVLRVAPAEQPAPAP